MLSKFRNLVIGPGPVEEHPVDPYRPGMVVDIGDTSWVNGIIQGNETHRFPYSRPDFLQLLSDDEVSVSGDQSTRPVLVPKDFSLLPCRAGYAETINAGKTEQNEDQACAKAISIVSKKPPLPVSAEQLAKGGRYAKDFMLMAQSRPADELQEDEVATDAGEWQDSEQIQDTEPETGDGDDELIAVDEKEEPDLTQTEYAREEGIVFGIFDGHAGTGAALMASNCLSEHVKEKLANSLDLIHLLDQQEKLVGFTSGCATDVLPIGTQSGKKLTRDSMVIGALETAFVDMDDQIQSEKYFFKISGGCATVLALFFLRRLYLANAGDCRALLVGPQIAPRQLSTDFTPDSERKRLQQIAYVYPDFTGRHFSRLEYSRRLYRRDLKKRVLYRDWYMDGWAQKTVREGDLRYPLISSGGKKPRLLNTIGVTRGFGDHHLVTVNHAVPIKPFLSPVPEVRVLDLPTMNPGPNDVLVLASDGLWDVLTNQEVASTVLSTLEQHPPSDVTRYTLAAQDLVVLARGQLTHSGAWRRPASACCYGSNTLAPQTASYDALTSASTDDITVFVVPLANAMQGEKGEDDVEMLKEL